MKRDSVVLGRIRKSREFESCDKKGFKRHCRGIQKDGEPEISHLPAKRRIRFKSEVEIVHYDLELPPVYFRDDPMYWLNILEFGNEEDLRGLYEALSCVLLPNTRHKREIAGARIFTDDEFEKFFFLSDLGLRTHVSLEEAEQFSLELEKRLMDESENEKDNEREARLRKFLAKFFAEDNIDELDLEVVESLVEDKYMEDLGEAEGMRELCLSRELSARESDVEGDLQTRLEALKKILDDEQSTIKDEEQEVKSLLSGFPSSASRDEIRALSENVIMTWVKRRLDCLKLPKTGSLKELCIRLRLFRLMHESSKGFSARSLIQDLSFESKLTLSDLLRIGISSDDKIPGSRMLEKKLYRALVESMDKFPARYEYGTSSLEAECINELDPGSLRRLASQFEKNLGGLHHKLIKVKEGLRGVLVQRYWSTLANTILHHLGLLGEAPGSFSDMSKFKSSKSGRKVVIRLLANLEAKVASKITRVTHEEIVTALTCECCRSILS